MQHILSFGGGVNSTALYLLLEDRGIEFESVFVDVGGEHPETYSYIEYLSERGFRIKTLKPNVQGFDNLYDYCIHKKLIPSRILRWCTFRFKIDTMKRYFKDFGKIINYIGIDYSERKRMEGYKPNNNIEYRFPLIQNNITRDGCKKIIKNHNLKVPRKSGCWFCPFASKKDYIILFFEHPELFKKAVDLEKNCMRKDIFLRDQPLESLVEGFTQITDYVKNIEAYKKSMRK